MASTERPTKPYKGFPLTAHPNGSWCKKIRGRLHYFGPWEDWQAALDLYLAQRDDLHAGRKPRAGNVDGPTLAEAMDRFLSSKKEAERCGEISPRSYNDYERTCDRVAKALPKNRLLTEIDDTDLSKLRAALSKGKRGKKLGPGTIKGDLTRTRMLMLYINEYLIDKPIRYRKALRAPSRRVDGG